VRWIGLIVAGALVAGGCGGEKPSKPLPQARASIRVASPAFAEGGLIPPRYTCDGKDVSPPLRFTGIPGRARELALLVEDPDAGHFVHWSLLALSPRTTSLGEGSVPPGAVQTKNGFGDRRWGGPCPPKGKGPHHYVFALYALDKRLGLGGSASADEVRSAVAAAALARGTLTATYGR
jgi:Raf kinase inhibitor-like YbhB/YbcL family protein